jgi:putative glutamine amidotransferase
VWATLDRVTCSTQASGVGMLEAVRPTIGVAADLDADGEDLVERPYLDGLLRAGADPKVISSSEEARICCPSALLICGGFFDISPEWYGEVRRARLDPPRERRSLFERSLLEHADRSDLPVLGICNGAQLMAVVRGGTLVQDLATLRPGTLDHERSDERERPVHPVEIVPDSRLAATLGETRIEVNSTHHQSIDRPGVRVRIVGRAPDGVVEAIEDPDRPFWIGVQWHPERLADAHSARLFEALVEAACRHGSSR